MAKISKILYIVTQSELGGAQRYILDLAANLPPEQYEIMVAAGGQEKLFDQLEQLRITAYPLKHLVRPINPWQDILAYREIKKLLKKIQPDVVHLNSSKAGVIGAIAAHRAKIKKIIYTVHGFVFNEPTSTWKKRFYLWLEKFSAKYKNILICVSDFDRQIGLENNIADDQKLVTINNGIPPLFFLSRPQAREKLNLAQDKIIVGTVANLYATKGLVYLIQATKILVRTFPEIIFAVIGDGQLKNQLRGKIKELNLENNFLLLGTKENAGQYLAGFDLYVCSSVKEGFPFSILEAMAAGLPIVATSVGGIPEMIRDQKNGVLVPAENPQALAEAIDQLWQNKSLAAEFSRQAQFDALNIFTLKKMVEKTKQFYD